MLINNSIRNLKNMRKFAAYFLDGQKEQAVIALLSWTHNLRIMDAAKTAEETVIGK